MLFATLVARHKRILISAIIHFSVVSVLFLIVLTFKTILDNVALLTTIKACFLRRAPICGPA